MGRGGMRCLSHQHSPALHQVLQGLPVKDGVDEGGRSGLHTTLTIRHISRTMPPHVAHVHKGSVHMSVQKLVPAGLL